jgi:hypothetical protein
MLINYFVTLTLTDFTTMKERQLASLKQNNTTVSQNSAEWITNKETRQEVAEIAVAFSAKLYTKKYQR